MSQKELAETLKELTYEHIIFSKRCGELADLLNKDAPGAINEFIKFFENSVIPHREREEARVPNDLKIEARRGTFN